MPRVAALFRHPIKGLTPFACDRIAIGDDGRVVGDRVAAFRFATAIEPALRDGLEHWQKSEGLSLQEYPSLARLETTFDEATLRLRISIEGEVLVDGRLDAHADRAAIERAVEAFVLASPEADRLRRPGRLPLALVGDGIRSRFHDRARGFVSLHGTASIAALGAVMGIDLDERRFRSNIAVDGLDAWAELDWHGTVRIGDVAFDVEAPIQRCLATHANPDTGRRDAPVLTTLTREVGQPSPTFGVLLVPRVAGEISVGDPVEAVARM